jgi:hypothetical protein
MVKNNNLDCNTSFLKKFPLELIFEHVNTSDTLLEVANKLGFNDPTGLKRVDYEYFQSIKRRTIWNTYIKNKQNGWKKERTRSAFIKTISDETLKETLRYEGIESLSLLATHFLLSPKHGRAGLRERLLSLNSDDIPDSIYKGVHGVSKKPLHWPTPYYEKRIGDKPLICPICSFQAIKPVQIELHHNSGTDDYGPKTKRNVTYYQTADITPMCSNCHSLIHRQGEKSLNKCGAWRNGLPGNQKYKNPSDIFSENCAETYRVQRNYYLKRHLTSPEEYKCAKCGVVRWGPDQKVLCLEMHHVDQNHRNSLLSNLQLLCPNCHRSV